MQVAIRYLFHLHFDQVLFLACLALLEILRLLRKRPSIDAQFVDAQPQIHSFL